MKKLALVLLATMMSCTPEDQTQPKTVDCNCNRVVEVLTMNIVAGNGNVGITKMYRYTTINDCTKLQRDSSWSTQSVLIGECK